AELRLDLLDSFENVKVVASNLVSNAIGTINDVTRIAAWAHGHGAIHVCDAAQAAPHLRIDVQTLGTDFLAASGHKMCGPSGIGFLWGRSELLVAMEPFLMGRLHVDATNRASFYLYNVPEEVDRLAAGVRHVIDVFS